MQLHLPERLVDALIRRAKQSPYSHINDYMERYWLVPYRNKDAGAGCGPVPFIRRPIAWLIQRFGIAVRIHHIKRSDDDRAFHDHPWWYVTLILRGGYTEVKPVYSSGIYNGTRYDWCGEGTVLFRRARSWHRLEIPPFSSAWTLFITGPKSNSWGFLAEPNHKIYWRDYLNTRGKQ